MGRSVAMMMKGVEARVSSNFATIPNESSPIYKGVDYHACAIISRGQFYLQLKVCSILVRIQWRVLEGHGLGEENHCRNFGST
jgi:hypothetical protein